MCIRAFVRRTNARRAYAIAKQLHTQHMLSEGQHVLSMHKQMSSEGRHAYACSMCKQMSSEGRHAYTCLTHAFAFQANACVAYVFAFQANTYA